MRSGLPRLRVWARSAGSQASGLVSLRVPMVDYSVATTWDRTLKGRSWTPTCAIETSDQGRSSVAMYSSHYGTTQTSLSLFRTPNQGRSGAAMSTCAPSHCSPLKQRPDADMWPVPRDVSHQSEPDASPWHGGHLHLLRVGRLHVHTSGKQRASH